MKVHITFLDARSSILDSCVSKLERLAIQDVRIEFRGLRRDGQLTFEWYRTGGAAEFDFDWSTDQNV